MTDAAASWYDKHYAEHSSAHRSYPNEELLRFFGRHYFRLSRGERRGVRVLEVGCGSGANLWTIAREGFDAHGIDASQAGIDLCHRMLEQWKVSATLKVADMRAIPYEDQYFDVVVDAFSSYCLDEAGFAPFLKEVKRVLKPGGRFFSYTPSTGSQAFKDSGPSRLLDASTLDGIQRPDAPYYGNLYPFRFISGATYVDRLKSVGLRVEHCETVGRTYRSGAEYFEFVVVTAERPQIVTLQDIYSEDNEYVRRHLYTLLGERERADDINISHRKMPSYAEHCAFVAARPYLDWFSIHNDHGVWVGAVYLSKRHEIGVFILKDRQGHGYGSAAVRLLMEKHPGTAFLANINPANERSIKMFGKLGFEHLSNTYERRCE